jgi:hypothetical protein
MLSLEFHKDRFLQAISARPEALAERLAFEGNEQQSGKLHSCSIRKVDLIHKSIIDRLCVRV